MGFRRRFKGAALAAVWSARERLGSGWFKSGRKPDQAAVVQLGQR
jgi:hypothetical protein